MYYQINSRFLYIFVNNSSLSQLHHAQNKLKQRREKTICVETSGEIEKKLQSSSFQTIKMGLEIRKSCIFIVLAIQFSISTALISSPDVNPPLS